MIHSVVGHWSAARREWAVWGLTEQFVAVEGTGPDIGTAVAQLLEREAALAPDPEAARPAKVSHHDQ